MALPRNKGEGLQFAALVLTLASAAALTHARLLGTDAPAFQGRQTGVTGRKLLDYAIVLDANNATYTFSPFNAVGQDPSKQCYLTAGRGDATVQGPLRVSVARGVAGTVQFAANGDALVYQSRAGDATHLNVSEGVNGFTSATYSPAMNTPEGDSVTVTVGLEGKLGNKTFVCMLDIVFTVTGFPAVPAPSPSSLLLPAITKGPQTGRRLLDLSIALEANNATYTVSPFSATGQDPSKQCYFTAGRGDATVQGPLRVSIAHGATGTVQFTNNNTLVYQPNTGDFNNLNVTQDANGFVSVVYRPAINTPQGESTTVTAGLATTSTLGAAYPTFTCRLDIVFTVAGFPAVPAPSPSPLLPPATAKGPQTGRRLLDLPIALEANNATYTVSPFSATGQDPSAQCYLSAGRADATVQGPLRVSVDRGVAGTVQFASVNNDALVYQYNYGDSANLAISQGSNGFISATYKPNATSPQGDSVTVNVGLVRQYSDQTFLCKLDVIFTATGSSSNPSPPPPPPVVVPSPPPPPSGNTKCSSSYAGNPCFSTNGHYFNFAGNSTNVNCAVPAGKTCSLVTINPTLLGPAFRQVQSGPACKCN